MCTVEKGDIVSCQLSFLPIGSEEYLDEIDKVLNLIKATGLKYNIDILSTTIVGDSNKILDLINRIHKEMSFGGCNYMMNIIISNVCGC